MKLETLTGIVQSVDDPAKAGRIKASLPTMDGQEYPEWIAPIFPPGWVTMPEPGDEVEIVLPDGEDIIEFADEVRYRGKVLSENHAAPDEFKDSYPKARGYKTKYGHLLIFDDKEQFITLYTKDKHRLTLDDKNGKATLYHKDTMMVSLTDDGIFFGTEAAAEPMVLGELWKTLMDSLMGALLDHIHPTGVGPSGKMIPPEQTTITNLRASVNADDQLSDFIMGQKARP